MRGTAFEPGKTHVSPAVLNADRIVMDMQLMFDELRIPQSVWSTTKQCLEAIPIHELQTFAVHQFMVGQDTEFQGTQWTSQRMHARNQAATGIQRASGGSKRGLGNAVKPGLTPAEHTEHARKLPNLFRGSFRVRRGLEVCSNMHNHSWPRLKAVQAPAT